MTAPALVIAVRGTPAPKGNMRRTMHGHGMRDATKGLPAWTEAVRFEAQRAAEACAWQTAPRGTSVHIDVTFYLARPKGHTGARGALRPSAPTVPTTKPDLDKLAVETGERHNQRGAR